jgi:membrane protein DedA with SNARE-associated domain
MHDLIAWLVDFFETMGYPGIFLLMAMEGSIFPMPSELVIPRAGYLAHEGEMNLLAVIVTGTAGSLAGAYLNYFASRHLGRPLLLRYGRYFFISEKRFARAERFFLEHGEISTFIGRLLPVVRHLISVPAGLSGMNHWKFSLYTLLGSGLWVTILAGLGYWIGEEEELLALYSREALIVVAVFCTLLTGIYAWRHRRRRSGGATLKVL